VVRIAPSFGAIMLEDIAAPQCVWIERELKRRLEIPVFHDDQHGTAIVVSAAILNVCRHLRKELSSLRICVSGTGAAGSSICRMLKRLGAGEIRAYNKQGIVSCQKYEEYDFLIRELLDQGVVTSFEWNQEDSLRELIRGTDVFIGVSAPNLVDSAMVRSMAKDAVVFAMANPQPEILPETALAAGARIVGTGRSDFPNQINNVLIFPGLFRGALKSRAKQISEDMKLAAARGLAALVSDAELADDYILPRAFDRRVAKAVAEAVVHQAKIERVQE
jgi:malate dehydrogenase (oxaloacetate-decarboxylating)